MAAAPTASAPLPKQHLVFLRVVSVKAFVFSPGRGIFHRNNLYKLFMFVSSRGSGRGGGTECTVHSQRCTADGANVS